MTEDFQIVEAGDAAVIVEFAERIDSGINARAIAMAEAVRGLAQTGIRDVVSTFRSVAIYYDPLRTDQPRLLERLRLLASAEPAPASASPTPIRIPVDYGGAFGPDLSEVARFANASESEVVRIHTSTIYRVFMLGFLPGFAYLGAVDPRIAAPRRLTPRRSVPAGSVGIAGAQTGIYPMATPGGWQIIGRTEVRPFDVSRPDPCLFQAGDSVQFFAADRSQ
jgi:KipI family sensor histidine kinase inhibitor